MTSMRPSERMCVLVCVRVANCSVLTHCLGGALTPPGWLGRAPAMQHTQHTTQSPVPQPQPGPGEGYTGLSRGVPLTTKPLASKRTLSIVVHCLSNTAHFCKFILIMAELSRVPWYLYVEHSP